jgi:probable rRNA maturation factor
MLTIHGVLHLLGYDHSEPDEEKVMFGKTDVVLAEIFGD